MNYVFRYSILIAVSTSMLCAMHYDTDAVITRSPAYTIDTQFRALFLKPGGNNLYYAAEAFPFNDALTVPIISPHWNIYDLHPKYHFGFDLGLRGVFHDRNSTLSVNWEHFKSTTCAVTPAVATPHYPSPMMGPFSAIGPDAASYNIQASGRVIFNFNEVNVRYGQYVGFGDYLDTNFFGGISFADIQQCLQSIYTGSGDISQTITVPSSFIGAGPQFGVDFAYDIVKGLNFTGQVTGALLVGTVKNYTSYASASPILEEVGNPSPNLQSTCTQHRTQIVPSLSERLALAYFFPFCDHYMAKLEVGFEAKIFLNALQSTNLASGVIDVAPYANSVGVFARTFERTISAFSLSGPYIAFNLAF